MADYQSTQTVGVGTRASDIDVGLRAHMNKVYGLMSVGMAITGAVAWAIGTNPALVQTIFEVPYLNGETIRLDGGIRMQPK